VPKKLILLVLISLSAFAYTLEYIKSGPKSYARDFIIERYLEQDVSADEARQAFALLKSPKKSHKKLLLTKTDDEGLKSDFECEKLANLELNSSCILKNLSLSKLTKKLVDGELTLVGIQEFAQKIKDEDEDSFLVLAAIASGDPASFLANKPRHYLKAFFNSHKSYRRAVFNTKLDANATLLLSKQGDFARFVKFALFDKELGLLAASLKISEDDTSDSEALFYLGLLSLKYDDKEQAVKMFERSVVSATQDVKKDRARFWLYLVTKQEEWLRFIVSSGRLNFYSVNASEMLGTSFPRHKKLLLLEKKESPIDIKDPFEWLSIERSLSKMKKGELNALANKFDAKGLEPFYLRILEAKGESVSNVFLLNYTEYMKDASLDEKAMYLAIARQESAFIPTDISSAFALGVMQIIPLLAEELETKYKNKKKLSELFDPKINVPLAIKHFKKLRAKYKDIVFIAMSFNAGEGFFKRVTDEGLFAFDDEKTNSYEPFWSIENIPYDETRHYAKKVSTNYVAYKKILGGEASLVQILQNLKSPRQTERVSSAE